MIGIIVAAAAIVSTAAGPDAAIGRWRTESRGGIVDIARCGGSICGRLVSSEGLKADPALADARNKVAALRGRPLRDLLILSGFTRDAAGWSDGTIYNAEDGRTYTARVTPEGADRLKVRGCVFVPLCKTQIWTRLR